MEWYALYVKSRAEKKVAERLAAKGFEIFCPIETVIRQWSDRKKKIEQPFFRSYVFVFFDFADRVEVLSTAGVVNLVYWLNKPAIIRSEEMNAIIDFFNTHKASGIIAEEINAGQERTINQGILKDRVGVVLRKDKKKVVLEIKELGLIFTVAVEQTTKL